MEIKNVQVKIKTWAQVTTQKWPKTKPIKQRELCAETRECKKANSEWATK